VVKGTADVLGTPLKTVPPGYDPPSMPLTVVDSMLGRMYGRLWLRSYDSEYGVV